MNFWLNYCRWPAVCLKQVWSNLLHGANLNWMRFLLQSPLQLKVWFQAQQHLSRSHWTRKSWLAQSLTGQESLVQLWLKTWWRLAHLVTTTRVTSTECTGLWSQLFSQKEAPQLVTYTSCMFFQATKNIFSYKECLHYRISSTTCCIVPMRILNCFHNWIKRYMLVKNSGEFFYTISNAIFYLIQTVMTYS